MDSNDDVVFEIITCLDAISIIHLLSASTKLWNLRSKQHIVDRITPYQKYIKYKQWNKGLVEATKRNNFPQLVFFEQKGGDDYDAGLKYASRIGSKFLINYFLELGANNWTSAVYKASKAGNKELVDFFIEEGKWNLVQYSIIGITRQNKELINTQEEEARIVHAAVQGAAKNGHLELVKYLLSRQTTKEFINSDALANAAMKGHKDVIDVLIDHGCTDWNAGLQGAAEGNRLDLLEFFLQKVPTTEGLDFAMRTACLRGHIDAVKYLMSTECVEEWTSYLLLSAVGGHRELVDLLKDKGDPSFGFNYAAKGGNLDLVKYFEELQHGKVDFDEALTEAAKCGHLHIVKYAIEKGATQINFAMTQASAQDHREIIEYLIEQGATDWDNALEMAVRFQHRGLAELYIHKGATDLRSAFDIAAMDACKSLLEMFVLMKFVTLEEAIESVSNGRDVVEKYLKRRLANTEFDSTVAKEGIGSRQ